MSGGCGTHRCRCAVMLCPAARCCRRSARQYKGRSLAGRFYPRAYANDGDVTILPLSAFFSLSSSFPPCFLPLPSSSSPPPPRAHAYTHTMLHTHTDTRTAFSSARSRASPRYPRSLPRPRPTGGSPRTGRGGVHCPWLPGPRPGAAACPGRAGPGAETGAEAGTGAGAAAGRLPRWRRAVLGWSRAVVVLHIPV